MEFKSNKENVIKAITESKKDILDTIGAFVEAEAKLRTPVDTGTLRRSINFVVDEGESSVTIGTNVEYSSYVEKGSSKQKAQPFLTPAIEENLIKLQEIAEINFKIN